MITEGTYGGSSSRSLWNDLANASGVGFTYDVGGSSGGSSYSPSYSDGGGGGSSLFEDLGGWQNPGYDYSFGEYESSYLPPVIETPPPPEPIQLPASQYMTNGMSQSFGNSVMPSMTTNNMMNMTVPSQDAQVSPIVTSRSPISSESAMQINGIGNNSSKAGLDAWEAMSAEKQNRPVRISNMFGEEYDNGDKGTLLNLGALVDNQLRYVGNTQTNDAYLRDAVENGMLTSDEAYRVLHGMPQSITDETRLDKEHPVSKGFYDSTVEKIDDGTAHNYWKMTADSMTGTQYLHYHDDLGMGGRDNIDPNEVYSKRREALEHGFIPFMPSMSTYAEMVGSNVVDAPSRLGRTIANARDFITPDYGIEYSASDGERKSVSGREIDREAPAFMNRYYRDMQLNPQKFLSPMSDGRAYSPVVKQSEIPDINGNNTYHYGHIVDIAKSSDGSVKLLFSDGSSVKTSEDYIKTVMNPETGEVNIPNKGIPIQAALGKVDLANLDPNKHYITLDEYMIPDANGNETYHYGKYQVTKDENGNEVVVPPFTIRPEMDGSYTFTFQDDSVINVPQDYFNSIYDPDTGKVSPQNERIFLEDVKDMSNIVVDLPNREGPKDLKQADVLYMPDLMLSDGTRMTVNDVERILYDKTPGDDDNQKGLSDDDIGYKFSGVGHGSPISNVPIIGPAIDAGLTLVDNGLGLVGMHPIDNRPSNKGRLSNQEIFTDDGIDVSNIGNNAIDWTLGSLPISVSGPFPWLYSASGGIRAATTGTNPMSYSPSTDSYRLTAGGWDEDGNLKYGVYDEITDRFGKTHKVRNDDASDDVRNWSGLGNMAVPVTEQLVGPIGESIVPLEKIASKIPIRSALGRLATNGLVGAMGEGIEEILGNPFEEMTSYGSDIYATPVIDEKTGKPKVDQSGHEMRKHDTSVPERIGNFVNSTNDNLNAFAGGMLVDATMQLPIALSPWGSVRNAIAQDNARRMTGVPVYVSPEEMDEDDRYDVGLEYAKLFDDDMVRE